MTGRMPTLPPLPVSDQVAVERALAAVVRSIQQARTVWAQWAEAERKTATERAQLAEGADRLQPIGDSLTAAEDSICSALDYFAERWPVGRVMPGS